MKVPFPDWKWACIAAIGLLCVAAFVALVANPGGFEGQIAWAFGLLPGLIAAAYTSTYLYNAVPRMARTLELSLAFGLSFLWYFGVSYAGIRVFRVIARVLRNWGFI